MRRANRLRTRRGFTLIELLVSLLLLDVVLLALVGASVVAARQLGEARLRGRAAAVATSRFESVAASSCDGTAHAGRTQIERGLVESWSVGAPDHGVRTVVDTVELTASKTPSRFVFVSLAPC